MGFGGIGLFRLASARMEWLSERERTVAQNVANADTPGYQARDVVPFEAMLSGTPQVRPARTVAGHLAGTLPEAHVGPVRHTDPWMIDPNGNTVSLEQEMAKSSEIRETHTLVANIYQRGFSMLRTALSRS